MIHVSEDDVRRLLPMHQAIALVTGALRDWREGRAQNQPRRRLILPTGSVLHALAGSCGAYFGTKVYATNVKHGAWFHFLLYSAETGKPLALFDANWLGQIRTGAASGYATRLLAKPDSTVLGVIGTGFQAASQIEAIRCVRHLSEVRVYGRDAARRERFADENDARPVASAEEAVRGADIVVTATYAKDPVVEAGWLAAGAHINAMGSNQPAKRELPREVLDRASIIAVDSIEQSKVEAGDLLANGFEWTDPRLCEIKDVRERPSPCDLTLFKSNGLGLEDVAVAGYVYERLLGA